MKKDNSNKKPHDTTKEDDNEEEHQNTTNTSRSNPQLTKFPVIIPPVEPPVSPPSRSTRTTGETPQEEHHPVGKKKKKKNEDEEKAKGPVVLPPVEPSQTTGITTTKINSSHDDNIAKQMSNKATGKNTAEKPTPAPVRFPAQEPPNTNTNHLASLFPTQEVGSAKEQQQEVKLDGPEVKLDGPEVKLNGPVVISPREPHAQSLSRDSTPSTTQTPVVVHRQTPPNSAPHQQQQQQPGAMAIRQDTLAETPSSTAQNNQDHDQDDNNHAFAVMATPVEDPVLAEASPIIVTEHEEEERARREEMEKQQNQYKRKKMYGVFCLLQTVIVGAIVITLVLVFRQRDNGDNNREDDPSGLVGGDANGGLGTAAPPGIGQQPSPQTSSNSPTFSPSQAPTTQMERTIQSLRRLVVTERGLSTEQQVTEENSPQSQALRWIAEVIPPSWDFSDSSTKEAQEEEDHSREGMVLQAYALVVLYYATGGPTSWRARYGFLGTNALLENGFVDVCTWRQQVSDGETLLGVSDCSVDGRVLIIFLENNLLEGSIPSEIAALTALTSLDLSTNLLSSSIPTTIALLSRLETLNLNSNRLSGTVPTELGNMSSSLTRLALENNNLSGDVNALCIANNNNNNNNNSSSSVSRDFRVDRAKVHCACCTCCPEMSLRLQNVRRIVVGRNVSTIEDLADMNTPQYRAASWLADEDAAQIVVKDEVVNLVASPLPPVFEPERVVQRYALAVLYFATGGDKGGADGTGWLEDANFLSSQHECWWNDDEGRTGVRECTIEKLVTHLELDGNNLKNSIPKEIFHLQSLNELRLEDNLLSGTIPTEAGLLASNATHFALARNRLTGHIPSEIGLLTQLISLRLHTNRLSGSIPNELGRLERLDWFFSLAENELTGTLPSALLNLLNAPGLGIYLQDNHFNGSAEFLCREVEDVSSLFLYLDRNEVTCSCCECCPCAVEHGCSFDVRM